MKEFITFAVRLLALVASFPSVVVGNLSLFKKGNDNNGSPTKFLGDDNNNIAREGRAANTFHTATAGFTLIELLVVVLIIGILSAVAVPQYQVAVLKSRYAQSQILADAFFRAEELYFLANGTYTLDFTDLDIDYPVGWSLSESKKAVRGNEQECVLNDGTGHGKSLTVYCHSLRNTLLYYPVSNDLRLCGAGDAISTKVCKSLGGIYSHSVSNDRIDYYKLP